MLSDGDGLLDQVVEILWDLGSKTYNFIKKLEPKLKEIVKEN